MAAPWHLMRTLDWNTDAGKVINTVLHSATIPLLPSQIFERVDRMFPLGLLRTALAGGLACGDLVLLDDGRVTRTDQVEDIDAFNKDDTPMGWVAKRRNKIKRKREKLHLFKAMAAGLDRNVHWLEWKQCDDRVREMAPKIEEMEAKLRDDMADAGWGSFEPQDTP